MQHSLLKHPKLLSRAKSLPHHEGGRLFELYAAQAIVDCLTADESQYQDLVATVVLDLMDSMQSGDLYLSCARFEKDQRIGSDAPEQHPVLKTLQSLSIVADKNDVALDMVENSDDVERKGGSAAPEIRPLVVDKDRLYLLQVWKLSNRVQGWLNGRINQRKSAQPEKAEILTRVLNDLFPADEVSELDLDAPVIKGQTNWQQRAVEHALEASLTLLAGGPGTGKTTTAAKMLCLLNLKKQLEEGRPLSFRLLAPTGKASLRLLESIRAQLDSVETAVEHALETLRRDSNIAGLFPFKYRSLRESLPKTSETIHRFLSEFDALPGRRKTRASLAELIGRQLSDNHASEDLILVDEASMIDLALMEALTKVVSPECSVIFMGDPFQLPPVEFGQVFSEWVRTYSDSASTPKSLERQLSPLVYLRKTYRFGGDLKTASELINSGDFEGFLKAFNAEPLAEHDESFVSDKQRVVSVFNSFNRARLRQSFTSGYDRFFELLQSQSNDVLALEEAFSEFQVLCSTYEGPLGVDSLNAIVESYFVNDLLSKQYTTAKLSRINDTVLYHGKPILVTKNQHALNINNGDIGFVFLDRANTAMLMVPQGNSEPLSVLLQRVDSWQSAYAMSVHKSQGSEYRSVSLVLANYAQELLTRSLLYTGLTRAKSSCDIWSDLPSIERAFNN